MTDHDLLGQSVKYTNSLGFESTGILVGIVDEPSYIIAQPWADQDLVVVKSKIKDLRPMVTS